MGQGFKDGGGRGVNVLLSGGTAISCNVGAFWDSRSAVLCVWVATPCCVAAYVCVGVVAECARLRLMALGSASTRRFLFLIMPKRRYCDKSVSASINDLYMR